MAEDAAVTEAERAHHSEADLPAEAFDLGRPLYRQDGGTSGAASDAFVQLDLFTGPLADLIAAVRRKALDVRAVETAHVARQVLDQDRALPVDRLEDRIGPIGAAAELVGLKASAFAAERRPGKLDPAAERDHAWHDRRATLRCAARRLNAREVTGRDVFAARRTGKLGGGRGVREQTPDALRATWDALVAAARDRDEQRAGPRPPATVPLTEAEARVALDEAMNGGVASAGPISLRELAGRLSRERNLPAGPIEGVLTLSAVYAAASGEVALTQDRPGGSLEVRRP